MPKKQRQIKRSSRNVERAGRAPARSAEHPPVKKDDPSRDKTEMKGSVLQPLPSAD